jgi:aminomethyltransferase
MCRFALSGPGALPFLQHVLTNNATALDPGFAQYTMIPDESGGTRDDAYLYRFTAREYLLVVNAANRAADWRYLQEKLPDFPGVEIEDRTEAVAMLALQGPRSREILAGAIGGGALPEPLRNTLGEVTIAGIRVPLSRTGYTGEPLGFECFPAAADAPRLWDLLLARGATPAGLGARDTLRLEAGLPLYGHELGREIPLFACPLARFAVSFSPLKGAFVGRDALEAQAAALGKIRAGDFSALADLPQIVMPFALRERGVARAGCRVFRSGEAAGVVTSGTVVPYWKTAGEGLKTRFTGERGMRAIGLMLADSRLKEGDEVAIEIRGNRVAAVVVPAHLHSATPPRAVPILAGRPAR